MGLALLCSSTTAVVSCGDNNPSELKADESVSVTVAEDGSVAINPHAVAPPNVALTFTASSPAHGEISGAGPTFQYRPTANYNGADSFTVTIDDGGRSVDVPVAVTVTPVNDAPVASAVSASTNENQGVLVPLVGTDIDNTTLTFTVVTPPEHGTLAGVAPNLTYTPSDFYFGTDTFTYKVSDGDRESAVATATITIANVLTCGDGIVEGAEQCDDRNTDNTDACLNNCIAAACSDGFVQAGVEACDDGNGDNTDACLTTCVAASCGDGFTRAGIEACDDGNTSNTDACLATCVAAACGDGFTRAGIEACDDGNGSNTDACLNTCVAATCGDGFTRAGVETCDDGNGSNTDACLNTCVAATCGDGFTRAGVETCDDGNTNNTDACLNTCAAAACGDGFTRAGVEMCDDGNNNNTDACVGTCVAATCGDGFVRAGIEACDDGNLVNNDACSNSCALPVCGDGVLQAGEECDDANTADDDGCGHSCKIERCGDGLVQFPLGEQCDDGNTVNTDGCDNTCKTAPFVTTEPVLISGALSCTTSVANAARKVAVDGSGIVYAVMQCGTSAHAVVSRDRGVSFSAPFDLSAALPNAPVTVAQVAVSAGGSGRAYAAVQLNTGDVYLRITTDGGVTWGASALIGTAVSTSSGLSLAAFNDDVYIGFSVSGGVAVARNQTAGVGPFVLTNVGISIAFFDVMFDIVEGTVVVAADTPGFHIRKSADNGVTFASEVNPPGQEYYSDWAIGAGVIYAVGTNLGASGDADSIYVIPAANPTTSTRVVGLPAVSTAQTRTVAADAAGNAFVASQLNGGGVQLDKLPVGTTTFAAPRSLSPNGGSPIVTPLPGNQGAAVVFTVGAQVFATMQTY